MTPPVLHPSVTQDRVEAAVHEQMFGLGNGGFCLSCGADHDGCEPDASAYKCHSCGERAVEGAQNVLMMFC